MSDHDSQLERMREDWENPRRGGMDMQEADQREDEREQPTEREIVAFDAANVPERFDSQFMENPF